MMHETSDATDPSFIVDFDGLRQALDALRQSDFSPQSDLPISLPQEGLGEQETLVRLAPHVLGRACRLDGSDALAHMDPPTPWITWALALWNARLNQNLLHPATAPFARGAEERVIAWLAPVFGMAGGHMTPGSTLANLTAIWAARDAAGARRVVASDAAHLSIQKAAHILGLKFEAVPTDNHQRLDARLLGDLSDACLVLTAGTTAVGAIDPLMLAGRAAWTHVDAAWAGPLCLSAHHRHRLAGLEQADSVAVSAHKWLFQPKESALVFFRDVARANAAISFRGNYLTAPNIGLLGSHGAIAIPLLGTLMAWGRQGLAERIERCMFNAERVARAVGASGSFELLGDPETGVIVFRPRNESSESLGSRLGSSTVSMVRVRQQNWLRCVAANPLVDVDGIVEKLGLT